ncbi:orotidine 5'-phosphate decarboxylase / HUMPS family protein [Brenneria goodwinii]|uniref:orotidine 5'-phosphate decarboxylase / HUMPS family protein n=1 Tax=Brenneria goodwinii TaxID=1109412 RepID=UPI0036ED614E
MRIQLALDNISRNDALALLDNVHPYIDIVEVGTPFIIQEQITRDGLSKTLQPYTGLSAAHPLLKLSEYSYAELKSDA